MVPVPGTCDAGKIAKNRLAHLDGNVNILKTNHGKPAFGTVDEK